MGEGQHLPPLPPALRVRLDTPAGRGLIMVNTVLRDVFCNMIRISRYDHTLILEKGFFEK